MNFKYNKWSWILLVAGFGRIAASLAFFNAFLMMHLKLAVPLALLAVALSFIRTERMARWAFGVVSVQVVVTFITCYEAPRDFWRYLTLWIDYISLGQSAVAGLFLAESLRQHRKERKECHLTKAL